MKSAKRLLTLVIVVLLVLFVVVLSGCIETPPKPSKELSLPSLEKNQMAVVVKDSADRYLVYTVKLTEKITNVEQLLLAVAKQYDLHLVLQQSVYGANPVEIADIKASTEQRTFIAFFTTVQVDQGVGAGYPSFEVGDRQFVSAGVGISQAQAQGGQIVYFELSSY